ncbi:Uncharacterised protein [Klebsiella oxytoca]|nr:Uncharacterised protein [Klebsiella oxytoca]
MVFPVHVDNSVAFTHIALRTEDIDQPPAQVANHLRAIVKYRLFHGVDMVAMIGNAVVVSHLVYAVPGLNHPNAVFYREHRQTPVVVVAGNNGAKAQRINLPAPLGGLQIVILFIAKLHVIVDRRARRDRVAIQRFAGIVAKGQIVDFNLRHQRQILCSVDILQAFAGDHVHDLRAVALPGKGAQQVLV